LVYISLVDDDQHVTKCYFEQLTLHYSVPAASLTIGDTMKQFIVRRCTV